MAAFAGALLGLLASVGHIIADRGAASAPIPIGQIALYVGVAAALFAGVAIVRNRLVMRRGAATPAKPRAT